jgi:hypothetical protein
MFKYRGEVWAGGCELNLTTIVSFFFAAVCGGGVFVQKLRFKNYCCAPSVCEEDRSKVNNSHWCVSCARQ